MRRKREKETEQKEQEFPNEVKALQNALRKNQLKNELSEEMLKLSEDHIGIDLRKKFGSR
jgi:hypothetical protein